MIINVINRLKRAYPELYTSEQFGEYQLILARNATVTKVILVGMNTMTEDLYASLLSVKITRDNGLLDAIYDNGSTQFLLSMGDVLYSYDDKRNEKKLMEITEHELYEFLGGKVLDWIKNQFKMKYAVQKLVEKLVMET